MLLAFALTALAAPSAFAWSGDLQIRKVNLGGPSSDVFKFKITKTPNLYEDVWSPDYKILDLYGAPSADGPWIERWGPGPNPPGANSETYTELWAGFDHGFNDWVDYKVTEISASPSSLSDYSTTTSCSINGGDTWTTDNAITAQYGKWWWESGSTDGLPWVNTQVRWINNLRYVTTCVFTNIYRSRVRVKKTFDDPITANPSVTAEINGEAVPRGDDAGNAVEPEDTTLEHGQSTAYVKIPMGAAGPLSPVTVGESQGDQGDPPVSAYTKTLDCGEGVTATYDSGTGKWTLGGIAPGQDVTCELHNKRVPPESCTPPATGTPPNCTTPPEKCTPPATGTPPNCTTPPAVCTPPAMGTPPNCTTPPAVCTPPAMGTPPNCTTPPSGVSPEKTSGVTKRGTARLRGTVGCASASQAHAYITGSQIQRVTFYVNGRKVKTLSKTNDGKRYLLSYHVKSLHVGDYKVRARVEFKPSSKTSAKTYKLQFSRCAPRGVLPSFTG